MSTVAILTGLTALNLFSNLTEGHHQEWSLWLNLTQYGKSPKIETDPDCSDSDLFSHHSFGNRGFGSCDFGRCGFCRLEK